MLTCFQQYLKNKCSLITHVNTDKSSRHIMLLKTTRYPKNSDSRPCAPLKNRTYHMQIIVQVQIKLPYWSVGMHSSLLNRAEVTGEARVVI
jgi:hypothetical protein